MATSRLAGDKTNANIEYTRASNIDVARRENTGSE
jgi:hypothetical protein